MRLHTRFLPALVIAVLLTVGALNLGAQPAAASGYGWIGDALYHAAGGISDFTVPPGTHVWYV